MESTKKNYNYLYSIYPVFFALLNILILTYYFEFDPNWESNFERQTILIIFLNFIGVITTGLLVKHFLKQNILGFQLIILAVFVVLFFDNFQYFFDLRSFDPDQTAIFERKIFSIFGRLLFAVIILISSFRIEKIIPANVLKKRSINNIAFTSITCAVILLTTIYIRPQLAFNPILSSVEKYGYYYLTLVLLVIATLKFFIAFIKTNFRIYLWLFLAICVMLFCSLYDYKSSGPYDFFSEMYLILSIIGLSGFLIGINEDNSRFFALEKKLRSELERSLFETELSVQNYEFFLKKTSVWTGNLDKNNRLTFLDKNFLSILGYEKNEIIGKSVFQLPAKSSLPVIKREKEKWTSGADVQVEIEIAKKSGDNFCTTTDIIPVLNNRNEYQSAKIIFRDISAWKKVEKSYQKESNSLTKSLKNRSKDIAQLLEKYKTSKFYYKSLLAVSSEIVIVVNNENRCSYINDYGKKLTGFTAAEFNQNRIPKFLLDLNRLKSDYGKSVNLDLNDYQTNLKTKSGKVVKCIWNVQNIFNPDGNRTGIIGIGRDISKVAEAGNKQDQNLRNLTQKLEIKTSQIKILFLALANIFGSIPKTPTTKNSDLFLKDVCLFIQQLDWTNVFILLPNAISKKLAVRASSGRFIQNKNITSFVNEIINGNFTRHLMKEFQIGRSYLFDLSKNPIDNKKKKILLVPISEINPEGGWIFASAQSTKSENLSGQIELIESIASFVEHTIQNKGDLNKKESLLKNLKDENRLKTEFFSKISHEIRNPVNSILSISQILAT